MWCIWILFCHDQIPILILIRKSLILQQYIVHVTFVSFIKNRDLGENSDGESEFRYGRINVIKFSVLKICMRAKSTASYLCKKNSHKWLLTVVTLLLFNDFRIQNKFHCLVLIFHNPIDTWSGLWFSQKKFYIFLDV